MQADKDMARSLAAIMDWVRRASRFVSVDDLRHLGPMGVWQTISSFMFAPQRFAGGLRQELSDRDPEFVALVIELVERLGRSYFRCQCHGVQSIPERGPVLLVGNHNGAVMPTDTLLTVAAIWKRFGPDRPVHVLSHDLLWADPVGRRLASKFGMLRAHPDSATMALRAGHIVLDYPGSDLDGFRPFRRRNRIELAGRKGFLRVALREQAAVVPVVSVGTHEQLIVLTDGRRVARMAGLKRWIRSEGFPVVLAAPWGLTLGFFPYLPLPAQTTIQIGSPMPWGHLGPADAGAEPVLAQCYEQIRAVMQEMLDELSRDRVPWVGKRPRWARAAARSLRARVFASRP